MLRLGNDANGWQFGSLGKKMDKRTVQSAHKRIDGIDNRLVALEVRLEERWMEQLHRMRRLEHIILGSAAATIALLISLIME
jgi:hypothetical protein